MRVKIKIRDVAHANKHWWQIIAQPKDKKLGGKVLDFLGEWIVRGCRTNPRQIRLNKHRVRYWLSEGATPTRGAHRLLLKYGMVPPLPTPFGPRHKYFKPEKQYLPTPYWKHDRAQVGWWSPIGQNRPHKIAMFYKQKLQEEMNIIERRRRLNIAAMNALGGEMATAQSALDDAAAAEDTDGFESDDPDIFSRKRKFQVLLNKFEKHRNESQLALKGNDLRYNVYLRKLQKLARKDLGLDIAAYKDYVNNLKEFAHLNSDLNMFTAENLIVRMNGDIGHTDVDLSNGFGYRNGIRTDLKGTARYKANAAMIRRTLCKFLRTRSGFVSEKDKAAVKEFIANFGNYVCNDDTLLEQSRRLFIRARKHKQRAAQQFDFVEEILNDIDTHQLAEAKVSHREYVQIQKLVRFDKDIFNPEALYHKPNLFNENHMNYFVNFNRLPKKIPTDIKALLYRPQRMNKLKEAYFRLTKQCENDWQKQRDDFAAWKRDKRIRINHAPRAFDKKQEEWDLIYELVDGIKEFIIVDDKDKFRAIKNEIVKEGAPITEYIHPEKWFRPLLTRLISDRRQTPRELRKQNRQDSTDEIDTTDLEKWEFDNSTLLRGVFRKEVDGGAHDRNEFLEKRLLEIDEEVNEQSKKGRSDTVWIDGFEYPIEEVEELQRQLRGDQFLDPSEKNPITQAYEQIAKEMLDETKKDPFANFTETQKEMLGIAGNSDDEESYMMYKTTSDTEPERLDVIQENQLIRSRHQAEEERIIKMQKVDLARMFLGQDDTYTLKEFKKIYKAEIRKNPRLYTTAKENEKHLAGDKVQKKRQNQVNKVIRQAYDKMQDILLANTMEQTQKIHRENKYNSFKLDRALVDIRNETAEQNRIIELEQLSPEEKIARIKALQTIMLEKEAQALAQQVEDSKEQNLESKKILLEKEAKIREMLSKFGKSKSKNWTKEEQHEFDEYFNLGGSFATATNADLIEQEAIRQYRIIMGITWKQMQRRVAYFDDLSEADETTKTMARTLKVIEDKGWLEPVEPLTQEQKWAVEAELRINLEEREQHLAQLAKREELINNPGDPFEDLFDSKKFAEEMTGSEDFKSDDEEAVKAIEAKLQPIAERYFKWEEEMVDQFVGGFDSDLTEEGAEHVEKEEEPEPFDRDMAANAIKDFHANSEDPKLPKIISEEDLNEILDKIEAMENMTEEQMEEELERQLDDLSKIRAQNLLEPTRFVTERAHPYREYFKDPARYESKTWGEWILDQENYDKYADWHLDQVGRYPHGFRHYENYANYVAHDETKTIKDYMKRMNEPAEFSEFLAIMRAYMVQEARTEDELMEEMYRLKEKQAKIVDQEVDDSEDVTDTDTFNAKIKAEFDEPDPEQVRQDVLEKMQTFTMSDKFVDECLKEFNYRQREFLLRKRTYKFVDALEETMDFWEPGPKPFQMPVQNSYIPVRNTILKKPEFDNDHDEKDPFAQMRYNYADFKQSRQKTHSLEPLLPHRPERMAPFHKLAPNFEHLQARGSTRHMKWHRLSYGRPALPQMFSTRTRAYVQENNDFGGLGVSIPSKYLNMPKLDHTPYRQQQ